MNNGINNGNFERPLLAGLFEGAVVSWAGMPEDKGKDNKKKWGGLYHNLLYVYEMQVC